MPTPLSRHGTTATSMLAQQECTVPLLQLLPFLLKSGPRNRSQDEAE